MAISRNFKTIPGLFQALVEFGKASSKFLLMSKINSEYIGITYSEFGFQTEKFALGLSSLGIQKNDKIAIISENRPEWVYSDMAILGLGAVDVPLYPSLTSESIEFILNNSESAAIIVSNKFQLNKVLKIKNNCKTLKYIIVLNEKDIENNTHPVYSFKEIQKMGEELKKTKPDLFSESLKLANEEDLCTIIYTSGTTGEPKGVMLTHKNIVSNIKSLLEIFEINEKDIFLSFLPLCHIFERMGGYYTAFTSGATVYYAESIEAVAKNLTEAKPTILTTVPRLFERIYSRIIKNVESQSKNKQKIFYWAIKTGKKFALVKKREKISAVPAGRHALIKIKHKLADKLVFQKLREKTGGKLRFFVSGGAALPREMGEFFEAIGLIILEGYGLTESSPVISINRIDDYKFGTVGKAVPGVEIKIANDGEILAKGPNIMLGYYKNKKETNESLNDGWLHTGDIGIFDEEGFLKITDRKKHLFKTSAGKYIAPAPIENLFLSNKYIDQFMLIGDKKTFLSALIVPDFEALEEYADSNKIEYKNREDLTKNEKIYNLINNEISQLQKKLANYERVRKFVLLEKAFTIEGGEITPSLKIKRKFVEEKFKSIIESIYDEKKN